MSRQFAGILALVAFMVTLLQGLASGSDPSRVIQQACLALVLFAAIGAILGAVAGYIVDDSVRGQFRNQLSSVSGAAMPGSVATRSAQSGPMSAAGPAPAARQEAA